MKNHGAKCQKCQVIVVVVDRIEVTAKQSAPWGIFPLQMHTVKVRLGGWWLHAQGNRVMS